MKDRILEILAENNGYVSGELISKELLVSRAAIWKAVKSLRNDGYVIKAGSKKGYMLDPGFDVLTKTAVGSAMFDGELIFLHETDSTNTYLKELARKQYVEEGTCVFCEMQRQGRGRLGRSWYQEPFANVAMSVLLRPDIEPQLAPGYSILAGVCVYEVLYELTGAKPRMKWPNDILSDGRKLCGILTELDSEAEKVEFIVIGIGINVHKTASGMPEDVQDRAISLQEICKAQQLPKRAVIIRNILDKLQAMYEKNKSGITDEVICLWNRYSDSTGRRIRYNKDGKEQDAIIKGIDKDGGLLVDTASGKDRILSGMIFEIEGYDRSR